MGTTNPANFNTTLALANGGSGQTTKQAAFDAISPLTTKGDLLLYSTTNARLAVGTNNQILVADSSQTTGVKWAAYTGTVTSVGISSTTLTIGSSPITAAGPITITPPLSVTGNNILINGDMQVWQRGAGGSASFALTGSATSYTVDRWQAKCGSSTNITVTQTAGATSGSWLARVQRNNANAGTAVIYFAQSATRDMCIGAAGNVVSVSFKAACGANFSASGSNLTVTVYSGTGTSDISGIAGAFTGTSSVISTTKTLSTSLTSFSASSSTLGSTVTQLCVEFSYTPVSTASTNDWFQVTDVQLEISPQATNFQRRNFGWQLNACQAFYNKSFNYATAPAQNVGTGTGEYYSFMRNTLVSASESCMCFLFPNVMRASPTITLYNPSAANAQIRNNSTSADWSGSSADMATPMGMAVIGTTDSGATAGNNIIYHWQADADIT